MNVNQSYKYFRGIVSTYYSVYISYRCPTFGLVDTAYSVIRYIDVMGRFTLHAVMFLDNVVQIGSDFQAEIPDCISGIILLFLLLPGPIIKVHFRSNNLSFIVFITSIKGLGFVLTCVCLSSCLSVSQQILLKFLGELDVSAVCSWHGFITSDDDFSPRNSQFWWQSRYGSGSGPDPGIFWKVSLFTIELFTVEQMIQAGSSDVCLGVLRELMRGDVQGRLGGIVSRWIWVLSCTVRMLRIRIRNSANKCLLY